MLRLHDSLHCLVSGEWLEKVSAFVVAIDVQKWMATDSTFGSNDAVYQRMAYLSEERCTPQLSFEPKLRIGARDIPGDLDSRGGQAFNLYLNHGR